MGNRGRELPHCRDAIGMCEFRLRLTQATLARSKPFFSALLLGQIEHESDTFVPAPFEECAAEQYGYSAAVLPEVLLLERLEDPRRL